MKVNTKNKKGRTIVIAVDKFKGSLSSIEAAEAIREGILRHEPDANVIMMPMADGGEGSLDAMEKALTDSGREVEKVAVDTVDPLGGRVRAYFLIYGNPSGKREVFIELAQSSGLQLIPQKERDILRATTYGLGEVIRFAVQECDVSKVILAIGGSATNDGGFGMLTALGFRYKNTSVFRNKNVPSFLSTVEEINNSSVKDVCPELDEVQFEVACDVQNPLLGSNGATMVYALQKGAGSEDLEELEGAMENWARVVQLWYESSLQRTGAEASKEFPLSYEVPGTGAAGGVGFALYAVLGAKLVPGWELFSRAMRLEDEIATADLVITGEGKFDSQSLSGKLPYGVVQICRKYGKPLWLVCGIDSTTAGQKQEMGIEKVIALNQFEPDFDKCMKEAGRMIVDYW